ncbi:MAG: hypothetical protein P4L85_08730 [Paludisphaera borealis]|uniref:hypothetical protein n=1 Tax=Paludisphaera borealis TaxID=1387353 RepID=UPI002845E58E|nr:hypothetical protein [Paludisphaera borealis]MDR3619421.1 hypothetical protein [Paludisphaera borealis]
MLASFMVFAYFGPETVLPVTSIVATVIGVVMMMGRSSLHWMFAGVRRTARFCFRRGSSSSSSSPAPHAISARSAKRDAVETR